jgi:hypothetical protein
MSEIKDKLLGLKSKVPSETVSIPGVGEVEVPTRSKASVEKLTLFGVRQELEVDFLWELVRTAESKATARKRGWNPEAIEEMLVREFVKQDGAVSTPVTGQDVLELQRLMRDNALGVTTGHDPVKLVHLLVRDYDTKISRMIFAEGQAARRIAMTMQDWITKLEGFLTLNDREILQGAGKVSADLAKAHAEQEFDKFRVLDDQRFESDFDQMVKRLPAKKIRTANRFKASCDGPHPWFKTAPSRAT